MRAQLEFDFEPRGKIIPLGLKFGPATGEGKFSLSLLLIKGSKTPPDKLTWLEFLVRPDVSVLVVRFVDWLGRLFFKHKFLPEVR